MNKPFFSVIIPAHNSEAFISKCLESVKMQHFTDYELIVVCDDCQDKTATVARQYADRVIKTNHGTDGLARNTGIEFSLGQWLLFLDDDDWWLHEYVMDEIYQTIRHFGGEIDLVVFDFIWKGRGYYSNQADRVNIAVWSKAFRRGFLGETRFPSIRFTSDVPFMDEIISKQPRCVALHKLMYYYNYMREGSQTEEHTRGGGGEA